ncbi:MAG: hypothetical protein WEB90_00980 [Gemmatimonadota bacterium]
MYGRTMFSACLAVTAVSLVACGPTPEVEQQLAELPVVVAERDQLRSEVDELTAQIGQIEIQLASLTMIPAPTTEAGSRRSTTEAVGQLVAHVSEVEEQLTSAATRLRAVNATSTTQVQRIATLEASIAEERSAMEAQRQRVASLEAAISGLEAETVRQSEVNQRLERTVESLGDEANKVWYVVGTNDELLDRGIIREEGGSRVLFIFGKRGQTLVPARTVDPTMFTAGDLRQMASIPLAEGQAETKWKVVTPQDLTAVGSPLDDEGRVLGETLSIADPDRFWASSRYLIVVQS